MSLTCGEAARLASRVLADRGWRTRVLGARRVTGLYNTYDNGHTLLEFYWPRYRKWVLADTDLAHGYSRTAGTATATSACEEVAARIAAGERLVAQPLTTTPPRIDSSEAVAGRLLRIRAVRARLRGRRRAATPGTAACSRRPTTVDGATPVFRAATERASAGCFGATSPGPRCWRRKPGQSVSIAKES